MQVSACISEMLFRQTEPFVNIADFERRQEYNCQR
jgi:hypothetical protein